MKLLFTARGLPIGRYVVVRERDWGPDAPAAERKRVLDEIGELGWPVFVKPARGGSSIGTSRVTRLDDLEAAIEDARRYDRKVLVEAAVDGAEVECAVLEGIDGGAPEASVPGQIVVDPHSAFYDFEAKYLGAESRMDIPPPRRRNGSASSRARRSTRSPARGWRASTFSTPRPARSSSTRSTPCRA
jgi:D-alanine-D-alanine ligase